MLDKFEAGKGDEPRPHDKAKYNKNFDEIDWGKRPRGILKPLSDKTIRALPRIRKMMQKGICLLIASLFCSCAALPPGPAPYPDMYWDYNTGWQFKDDAKLKTVPMPGGHGTTTIPVGYHFKETKPGTFEIVPDK